MKIISATLAAAVALTSFDPAAAAAGRSLTEYGGGTSSPYGSVAAPPSAVFLPALGPAAAMPAAWDPAAAPAWTPAAAPAVAPAAAPTVGLEELAVPLADPDVDAAAHLERFYDASASEGGSSAVSAALPTDSEEAALPRRRARPAALLPPRSERRARGAAFPLVFSALSGAGWAAAKAAGWGALALGAQPHSEPLTALGVAAATAVVAAGVFALEAVLETAVFAAAVLRGRGTTDEQFRDFVRAEVLAGRLDANAAALLKPYRPRGRFTGLTFAFASRGSIWVRPELVASPLIFRLVLLHELHHWKAAPTRGPPAGGVRGLLASAWAEARARAAELKGPGALKGLKVPALERALRQARVSLRLGRPYEMLVLNPETAELADPKLYEALSDGAAKVTALSGVEPAKALGEAAGKDYQAVVLGRPAGVLPEAGSKDALRLETALKQLDSLFVLATRLVPQEAPFAGTGDARAYAELAEKARRLRAEGAPSQAMASFETEVRRFWRQIAAARLKGVAIVGLVDALYAALRDRGGAFLSFGPRDAGVATWERFLRYWESADGGRFGVTRVDLETGGHVLILSKVEARVGLWLRPLKGGRIETSVPRADDSEEGRAAARAALESAGFGEQTRLFDSLGVRVRHVFGADVGREEIYVTVPRRKAAALRKYVQARGESAVGSSDASFEPHLVESPGLQAVPPVWRAGITGAGGRILWVDTGADATHEDFAGRLDVVDMVNEGPEDWVGHGTHVAGISISGGSPFTGMAKAAAGTMAKVFSREQSGASDGEIMGSAAIAMQKGHDVISLSLGSRGTSGDNLADFFSRLTRRKNSAGDYPIVSASAGNSGPFDRTLSQPAAGADVLAVAAAAKSLDDGRPEIAFYSSVGPDVDGRHGARRWRLKPEIAGIGGDVTTEPGSSNVYKRGVDSAKSKDAARSPSDLEDGRHTGMSGTSMSNPAVAAIVLLVKLAMKAAGAWTPFVAENLPFAVKAVLMRTARDLEAPIWFQGAGLVDAWAAVKLVGAAAGREFGSRLKRLFGASAPPAEGWAWLERLKAVVDAEDRAYGEAADARRFNDAREREVPALSAALKDPVWLVRQRAAFALMNLRSPSSAMALSEAALGDADARVRSVAFLALGEIQTRSVDVLLRKASGDPRWDVGVYAAYALAKRGDRGGVSRIAAELANSDKRARYASAWLAGQLGMQVSASEAEALSARIKDRAERGNIRHLAAASLANVADAAPEAISDRVVTDVLDAAGPENLALTRTIVKFFSAALADRSFVARLRRDPLKTIVTSFVLKNKGSLQKPGALAELVQMLAKAANVPLDAPTAAGDPGGAGVAGVDPAMGDVDLIVASASNVPGAYADDSDAAGLARAFAEAGLGREILERFESSARAALPLSGALWLSVPEHKRYALTLELRRRGFAVRSAWPEYPQSVGRGEEGGVILDLGDGTARPALPDGADLSFVSVRASAGVSEARVMAALERLAAAVRGRGPTIVALTLSAPVEGRTPLTALVDRLVASGIGVVVGAGDSGPAAGTVASPGDAKLAVVVAAASSNGLQFYSARGTPEAPRVSWADIVDPLDLDELAAAAARRILGDGRAPLESGPALGTAAAAERTAAKLARLAKVLAGAFSARGLAVPEGWFSYLVSVAMASATPMPAHGAHEVGAGIFDEARARVELERRLAGDDGAPERRSSWWKDASATRHAVTVPLYALRREDGDSGIGKFADLGRYYREVLAPQGVDAMLLLPHFAVAGDSPYASVSLNALNEDNVDWSAVEEVRADPVLLASLRAPTLAQRQSVDYDALRAREGAAARAALARFRAGELAQDGPRARDFKRFLAENASWLDEYAEFMALVELIGKPVLDWTPRDQSRARSSPDFAAIVDARRFAQWIADRQLRAALDEVHAAGGKMLFDVPMFRAKNGVDAWRRPELFADLRTRNPGVKNAWTDEDWGDLALWRWSKLKSDGYREILGPFRRWLDFGFDGARADALHFAYLFGNGQMASGDEPGDDYVRALGEVFRSRGAFPLAEAFEGKDGNARRFGFVTVHGDWKSVSSHDDPRRADFLARYFGAAASPASGASAKFVAWTLGDEWRDPFPVKEMRGGFSRWEYRVPLPSDPDYAARARDDVRSLLRMRKAMKDGDPWADPAAARAALARAADGFVKHADGSVQIWAASLDWFLEEWGRDTFVSLPGLLLSTGRFDEAKENIRRFSRFERDGLIPNKIWDASRWSPRDPDGADYNSADAPMWFIQAVERVVSASGDWSFAREMAPVVRRIVDKYKAGTGYRRYGRFNRIGMDSDGLIATPAQSTWMDADPEGRDRPVTPRDGKAVEINALWYANLRFLARLERRLGEDAAAAGADALADKVKKSFNEKFWFETEENRRAWGGDGGALRDVVEGDAHGDAIRPNMLFAVSRGGDLLSAERRKAVVLAATRDLLTRYGPRTLSYRDSHYRESYDTSQPPAVKDQAYHQGTAWPWLMGAYADALARVRGDQGWDGARLRAEQRALLSPLLSFLASRPEGSLPEVFDGGASEEALRSFSLDDPDGLAAVFSSPSGQNPGGTRSQAWSVAEVLRILVERGLVPPGYDGSR